MSGDRGEAESSLWRFVPWVVGALVVVAAYPAAPQGNIDAGKTPAQMFSDTCSACHRRPQELRRTSASFLRQHYTPGAQEAAAMASYLAGIPASDTRGKEKERPKAAQDKEKAKSQPHQAQPPQQLPQPQQAQERPKAQQPPKGKKATEVAKSHIEAPAMPEAPPPELPVEAPPPPAAPAAVVPKLEPFEE